MEPVFISGRIVSASGDRPLSGRLVSLRVLYPASGRSPDYQPSGRARGGYAGPIAVNDISGEDGEFLMGIGVENKLAWVGGTFGINVYENDMGEGPYRTCLGNIGVYPDIAGILRYAGIISTDAHARAASSAALINRYCAGYTHVYPHRNFAVAPEIRTAHAAESGGRGARGAPRSPGGGLRGGRGTPFGLTPDMAAVGGAVLVRW